MSGSSCAGIRSVGEVRLGFGEESAILMMAPNKTDRDENRDCDSIPKPSSVSSLIEVSPSAFKVTADE